MKTVFNFIKTFKRTLFVIIAVVGLLGCEAERDLDFIENLNPPSNLRINISVSQDNTGTVTITPTGENTSSFTIDFGDGSEVEEIIAGQSAIHIYQEGTFTVTATAKNISGETASATQQFTLSFLPPENLEIFITQVSGDAFSINLRAEADLAAGFQAFFGDVPNEVPTPFGIGETITHTYADVGTYDVTVIALSGGTETIQVTETITIIDPLVLPIDFESTTINYQFIDFGGASTTVIDNPDASGVNTSSKVAQFFKETGAQTFAGTVIDIGAPIDFGNLTSFSVDVWSPLANSTVLLKLENADNSSIFVEVDATTTTQNQWEKLEFDFSDANLSEAYSRIVLFFDFGNAGNDDTFYFDNIALTEGSTGGEIVTLPLDFENPNLEYTIIGFEGANSTLINNPDVSGINTSSKVVETVKTVNAQFFAGTIIELDEAIDFSTTEKIAIKTWSPKQNIPVRLKLESDNGQQFVELDVNTTTTNQWEELVWDFTGLTSGLSLTKVVLFFEFVVDLPGDGSTYYFDDIQLKK